MAEISSASSKIATKSSRGIFRRGAGGGVAGGDALAAATARRLSKRVMPAVGSSGFPERTCARVTRGDCVGVGGVAVLFIVATRYQVRSRLEAW
jgi:hypothetical protein